MKSPAFQFYPADFLADENVTLMNNREIGCYIKLMCYGWREGSIPAAIEKLAKLCGEKSEDMAQLWLAIAPCFTLAMADAGRMLHPRLEEERAKQKNYRKERSESGRKGAKARWNKGFRPMAEPMAEPMAIDGSSSSSSSSSSSLEDKKERKERKKNDRPPSPRKRGVPFNDNDLIPEGLKTPSFLLAWHEWKQHRKDQKSPIETELTAKKALKILEGFGPEKAVKSIDQSIACGWTGLFEPRSQKPKRPESADNEFFDKLIAGAKAEEAKNGKG